jgi:uncharacterized protein YcnI
VVLFAAPAWGHVTVTPDEAPAGAEQRYANTVPGEKPVPTTRIEIELPRELRVISVEAPAGWSATAQSAADGRIVGASWSGGTIAEGQAVHFDVVARNPDDGAVLRWNVIQTYRDGSEVHWNGPPGGQFPAATSRVVAGSPWLQARTVAVLLVIAVAIVGGAVLWRRRRRGVS